MATKKKRTGKVTGSTKRPSRSNKQGASENKYIYYFILAVFLLLFAFIRLNFLEIPFERDEGDYALAGQLALEGETPYIDFYEQKPPGLFYSYALVIALAGKTLSGVHFAFIIVNLLTTLLIFFCGRQLIDLKTGLVASISFLILSMNPSVSGFTAQSEHLLVLFMCGGLLSGITGLKNKDNRLLFAAGLLFCWATMIKQNGIFFIAFMGIMIILHDYFKKRKLREIMLHAGIYAGGIFSMLALISFVMLAQGSFKEMIFWVYEFPKESYVNAIPLSKGLEYFEFWLYKATAYYWPFWLLGAIGTITIWFSGKTKYIKWFILLFFLFSFASIVPGYRFYPHYWIHFLPGVALAAGAAIHGLAFVLNRIKQFNHGSTVAVGLFILLGIMNIATLDDYYFSPNLDNVVRSTYGSNPFSETKVLSDFIRRRSTPTDKMVVVGSEPQMHFYTQLMSPSRHTFLSFLIANHPRQNVWREELKQAVQQDRPRFIVMVIHPFSWAMPQNADQSIINWFDNLTKSSEYAPIAHVNLDQAGNPIFYWENNAVNPSQRGTQYIRVFERR